MGPRISATREVAAPPERVFAFLADLENHWRLEGHFVALDELEADGGRVRIRGPFGLSRVARTRVLEAVPHERLRGEAVVGKTVGRVAWDIAPASGGSSVTLSADVVSATPVDRVLLAVGGRTYLRRIFEHALENLEGVVRP